MLQEDGTIVLRLIFETLQVKNLSWNPVCGLSEVVHALSLVYVDDFMLASSDSAFGNIFESINNLYECGKCETRVSKQCGAQITLPSNRRRDKKSKITPLELSQLRALNGQLLWFGMQCLPQLLAPLSLLIGQTPQATVGTIYEVTNWLGRRLRGHGHNSKSTLIILLF